MPNQHGPSDTALAELEQRLDIHISELADSIAERGLDDSMWADEDLERFHTECGGEFDESDAPEDVDTPICDEAACPVAEVCPFGPGASGLSEDEALDILESCELTHDRAKGLRGIPGLEDALEGAGWPVYRVGFE